MTAKEIRNFNKKLHITLRPENGIELTTEERLMLIKCEIECKDCSKCLTEEHTNWVKFYCQAQEREDRRHGIRGYINNSDRVCSSFIQITEIGTKIEMAEYILDAIWKRNDREYVSYIENHPEYDECTDKQKKDVLLNRIIKLKHYGTDEDKAEIENMEMERQAI